jgi:hypothetical protein
MSEAAANAPMFIDAFYSACESLKAANPEMAVPGIRRINRILAEGSGYEIRGDELVSTQGAKPIHVPERPPSLDHEAQGLITEALANADHALVQGNGRQAVQELLWLLETIATAFRGIETSEGSVQGRYFNKIVSELRADHRGKHQQQILTWMMALHGFLSSPTGGGIRHGVDLAEGVAAGINEARLYCNLIRSYTAYLIAEHERLRS